MIELLIGIMIGLIAGLVPGLHPNTLIPIIITASAFINPLSMAIILTTTLVSTNFFEFIKTTYLSAPDEGNSLTIKYAQQLLLNGRGAEAVKLLSIGALGTTLITAALAPTITGLIINAQEIIENYVAITLILISMHLILQEKTKIGKATIIYTLAAILGTITLRSQIINQPMLPLLTGLYGTSNIVKNLKEQRQVPKQMSKLVTDVSREAKIKGITKAALSSSIITVVPAIGPSQAAMISNEIMKTNNQKEKLITLGGVNTGDVVFSLTALYAINKARSGVIEQISKEIMNQQNYLTILLASVITAIISYWLVNKIANKVSQQINKIDYKKLNIVLLIFITTVVTIISSWTGILVLITATLIGLESIKEEVNQNHLMAAIIMPTIIYYL